MFRSIYAVPTGYQLHAVALVEIPDEGKRWAASKWVRLEGGPEKTLDVTNPRMETDVYWI